jgi:glycosyltransferase involved in cell wall biosynthesis
LAIIWRQRQDKRHTMPMKKIKILGLITEDSAVGYYRIWQPLKMLERLGLAELKLTPTFDWGRSKSETTTFPELKWFGMEPENPYRMYPDIIVAERHDSPNYFALINTLAHNFKIPLVIDTDDDVQAVRPFNPGFTSYNPNSDNVAFNIKLMSSPELAAITTSTEHLKERHAKYNKPTYVVPNSIDFKERVLEPQKRNKRLRIGWLGSACHYENLQIILQPVKDILANFDVELVFTNLYHDVWHNPPEKIAKKVIPVCQIYGCKERHGTCPRAYKTFDEYAKMVNNLKVDIGLAPLRDNLFNRSKSNLRILEYWADKIAVVASPVKPYLETIKNGKNGFFAKEQKDWYEAIKKLIVDDKLRESIKQNGFETLNKNYNAEKNALKLYKVYSEIIKNYGRNSTRDKKL